MAANTPGSVDNLQNVLRPDIGTEENATGISALHLSNRTVYQKIINVGALPNATTKSVATGITWPFTLLRAEGAATNGTTQLTLPYAARNSLAISVQFNSSNLRLISLSNYSSYSGSILVTYVKAT